MMRAIWKFPVTAADQFTLTLPVGARVLEVATQYEHPQMWVLVDPDAHMEERTFYVCGTGHAIAENLNYLGSFQLDAGAFVGHVFEAA
jgi:hypothetical protein